ncbi:FecR domain-containing protein [Balneolales bacterium ANBcel1]|nr:FecR domain-containing protein [Balneolales bacterium ANBcel1]
MQADIILYDILGREVTRTSSEFQAGRNEIQVTLGSGLAQGQYLLHVRANAFSETRPMTFISTGRGQSHTAIRVAAAGTPSGSVTGKTDGTSDTSPEGSGKMPLEDDNLLLVIEECEHYPGKELTISAGLDHDAGTIALPRKKTYWQGWISGQGKMSIEGVAEFTSEFSMDITNAAVSTNPWFEEQKSFDGWATAYYQKPGYTFIDPDLAQFTRHYDVKTPSRSGEIEGRLHWSEVWRELDSYWGLKYADVRPVITHWACHPIIGCTDPKGDWESSILAFDGGTFSQNTVGFPFQVSAMPLDFIIDGDRMPVQLPEEFHEVSVDIESILDAGDVPELYLPILLEFEDESVELSYTVEGKLYRVHWETDEMEPGKVIETDKHTRKKIEHEVEDPDAMDPMERFELFLDAQTEIEMLTKGPEPEATHLELFRGKLRAKISDHKGPFRVLTPTAVYGVRGTDFLVEVHGDSATTVIVLDGEVEVSSSDGSGTVILEAYEKTVVKKGDHPNEPETIDEIPAIRRWWEQADVSHRYN